MLKQFFKDSFLYGFASFLSRGISVLLVPIYTRILSPGDFGIIDFMATFASFISVIVPLGIANGVARYFSDAESEADKISYASSALWFTATAYGFFALIAFLFADGLTMTLLESLKWRDFFYVSVIAIVANGIFYFFQNLLRWQLQPRYYVISSLAATTVTAAVALFTILYLHMGVIGIFLGQIMGACAGSAIAWFVSKRLFKLVIVGQKLKLMLVFSLPIVPALIGEFITNYIDRIAIRSLLTINDLGLYGVGFRFASIVSLLMLGFNNSLTPLIYNNYQKESTPHELARIFRYFLALSLPLILAIALFTREILWIFTTPQFYSAWSVMPILSAAFLLNTMYNFTPGIDIAKKTKIIALIHFSSATLNTVLNFTLIPYFGIVGSGLATLLSAFFSFSAYMIFSQKYYQVPHHWRRILGAVGVGLATFSLGIFLSRATISVSAISLKIPLLLISCGLMHWVLFGQDEIKLISRKLLRNQL